MKMQKLFACIAAAVVVALAGAWAEAATTAAPVGTPLTAADVNAWLDGYMPYALKTGDISGAVVVVV